MRFSCYFKHSWLSVCKHCFPSACILVAQLVYTLSMLSEFQTPPVFYRLDPYFFSHSFESWVWLAYLLTAELLFVFSQQSGQNFPSESYHGPPPMTILILRCDWQRKQKTLCINGSSPAGWSPVLVEDPLLGLGMKEVQEAPPSSFCIVPLSSLSCSSCSLYLLL